MIIYNNDILAANASDKEHLETLGKVFAKLQESGLKLKQSKCSFMLISVKYLDTAYSRRYSSNTSIIRSTSTSKCPVQIIPGPSQLLW